jgi:hypothetical protein
VSLPAVAGESASQHSQAKTLREHIEQIRRIVERPIQPIEASGVALAGASPSK